MKQSDRVNLIVGLILFIVLSSNSILMLGYEYTWHVNILEVIKLILLVFISFYILFILYKNNYYKYQGTILVLFIIIISLVDLIILIMDKYANIPLLSFMNSIYLIYEGVKLERFNDSSKTIAKVLFDNRMVTYFFVITIIFFLTTNGFQEFIKQLFI